MLYFEERFILGILGRFEINIGRNQGYKRVAYGRNVIVNCIAILRDFKIFLFDSMTF
jgi:hypothetical protein